MVTSRHVRGINNSNSNEGNGHDERTRKSLICNDACDSAWRLLSDWFIRVRQCFLPTGSDTLRVGVRADIVNFGYLNEQTGKYYGMEIDLANEMANRLGYSNVELVTVLPDNRKEMLLNGEVDCLVACYSKTDTRLENSDFSPIYYTDATPVMVENSSRITDINQLKDGTFGIMSGSNAGSLLVIKLFDMGIIGEEVISNTDESTEYDHATVIKFPSYEELSIALEEGRVDAAVMDGAFVDTYINDDRSLLEDFSVSDQDYAVATQKRSNLSQSVADTIQAMLDDGTIATLIDKWD